MVQISPKLTDATIEFLNSVDTEPKRFQGTVLHNMSQLGVCAMLTQDPFLMPQTLGALQSLVIIANQKPDSIFRSAASASDRAIVLEFPLLLKRIKTALEKDLQGAGEDKNHTDVANMHLVLIDALQSIFDRTIGPIKKEAAISRRK